MRDKFTLKQLIAQGKVKKVLDLLLTSLVNTDFSKDILLISSNIQETQKAFYVFNLLSQSDFEVAWSKEIYQLLNLIDSLNIPEIDEADNLEMSEKINKNSLKELIAQSEIETVIRLLLNYLKGKKQYVQELNIVIINSEKFRRLEDDNKKAIITKTNYNVNSNKIRLSLLTTVTELDLTNIENVSEIDLGKKGLLYIPKETFELSNLKRLSYSNEVYDYQSEQWIISKNQGINNKLNKIPVQLGLLHNLTHLYLGAGKGYWYINDITALKNLKKLEILHLRGNQISDIQPLVPLTKLHTFDLSGNQVSNIQVLEQLTNLQTLDLSYNNISELKGLEKLTQLRILNCSYNQIVNLQPLAKLIHLKTLNLAGNQIDNIEALAGLFNLQILNLSYNKLLDITPLISLPNLRTLNISYNPILNFNPIKEMLNLTSLSIVGNNLLEANFLKDNKALEHLDVHNNTFSNLVFLKNLNHLLNLNLSNNSITDFSILGKLTKLKKLDLSLNNITNIQFLEGLSSLKTLDLSYNQLSVIQALEKHTELNNFGS